MSTYYVEVDGLTVYATQSRSVAYEALEDTRAHWPDAKDIRITEVPPVRRVEADEPDD